MSYDKGQSSIYEELAQELAERLGDPDGYRNYVKLSRLYSESSLRSILSKVLEVPAERIRKSRGALFTSLVQRDGEKAENQGSAADARGLPGGAGNGVRGA